MKKITLFSGFCLLVLTLLVDQSCKKKEKTEPEEVVITPTFPSDKKITISQIKAKFNSNPSQNYKFTDDSLLYCTVIADEVSGNFFKELFVQDNAGAIRLKLKSSSTFIIGDSLKVNIKGSYLNNEYNLIQIDSIDPGTMITKLGSGKTITPVVRTLAELNSTVSPYSSFQSSLVKIENVEFVGLSYPTYADPVLFTSKNHTIQGCGSPETIVVRTSGYANFAGSAPPNANGSIIAIVSQFSNTTQLRIRKLADVTMTGTLCNSVYHSKNFEDLSLTSGGWTQQAVSGSIPWKIGTFNSLNFVSCNNYTAGANSPCETWLISPAINLTSSTNPKLYFQNACKFNGPAIEVYVSTNYNSGLPNTASWTQLFPTLSTGNYVYVGSGGLSLNSFKNANTRIAFKYTGSAVDGRDWQLDDIVVKEN